MEGADAGQLSREVASLASSHEFQWPAGILPRAAVCCCPAFPLEAIIRINPQAWTTPLIPAKAPEVTMQAVPDDHDVAAAGARCRMPILAALCFLWISPLVAWAGDAAAVNFSRDVLPILSENCLLCHGPDAKTRKAELRLDVKESALRAKSRSSCRARAPTAS